VWVGVISVFLGSADPFLRPRQGNDVVRDTIAGGRQSGSFHFGKENGYSATRCGLGRRYSVFLRERRLFLFAGLAGGKTGSGQAREETETMGVIAELGLSAKAQAFLTATPFKSYIGGEWVASANGQKMVTVDPGSGETLAEFFVMQPADVDRAIDAADKAFRTSGWAGMTPEQRAE
jgi:hypothetical protein